MPLVRSTGNIPAVVDNEIVNSTMSLGEEPCSNNRDILSSMNRPRTRLQARKEALHFENENNPVQQTIDDRLQEFRDEISNMLAEGFRNFALSNQASGMQDRQENYAESTNRQHFEPEIRNLPRNYSQNIGNERRNTNDHNPNSERILNLIRNWRIKFTGDSSGISVEEFIYRINTLTIANLNGDFDLLCEHAHILFEGKASTWYWRFHKITGGMEWDELCDALKRQFMDYNTDYDIKFDIMRRKQKHSESFDEFHDAIILLCDKLLVPLSDSELCEILHRNLRPELRHEILHLEFSRVSQLRRAIRKHEKFVRDTAFLNFNKQLYQKPRISEVLTDNISYDSEYEVSENHEICLLAKNGKCWNCEMVGHSFVDCLEPRTIFCYGCGAKNTYKPKCSKCNSKEGNVLRDVRAKKDGHPNHKSLQNFNLKLYLDELFKAQTEKMGQQNKKIMEALAAQTALTKMLIKQDEAANNLAKLFPINSEEALIELEKQIEQNSKNVYLAAIKDIIKKNIYKNIGLIISEDLLYTFNTDGTHGKKRLKDFANFYDVLKEAVKADADIDDVEGAIRKAISLIKKRYLKKILKERSIQTHTDNV